MGYVSLNGNLLVNRWTERCEFGMCAEAIDLRFPFGGESIPSTSVLTLSGPRCRGLARLVLAMLAVSPTMIFIMNLSVSGPRRTK